MNSRFLIYLDGKSKHFTREQSRSTLLHTRDILSDLSYIEVRDIRISSYFIEIDLSVYDYNQNQLPKTVLSKLDSIGLLLYYEKLSESEMTVTKEDKIEHAIFLFNMERFWKSHEVLEGIWKMSSGLEKQILNGLILIAAAFVHYQKNEIDIFISILKRSLKKLEDCYGTYYCLNLDEIKLVVVNQLYKNNYNTFKILTKHI
ncbi:MAG TPA: DUF309 domain-containing protein [Candidatus Nitrosocosmicus sp.]